MLSIYTGAMVEQSCSRVSFFHHLAGGGGVVGT